MLVLNEIIGTSPMPWERPQCHANAMALPRNLKVKVPGFAKATVHSVLHTKKYWDTLADRLEAVAPEQRIKVLFNTAYELQLGKFPY